MSDVGSWFHRWGIYALYCQLFLWQNKTSSFPSSSKYYCPSVLWRCCFGYIACKNRPWKTHYVSDGTLNLTHSIYLFYSMFPSSHDMHTYLGNVILVELRTMAPNPICQTWWMLVRPITGNSWKCSHQVTDFEVKNSLNLISAGAPPNAAGQCSPKPYVFPFDALSVLILGCSSFWNVPTTLVSGYQHNWFIGIDEAHSAKRYQSQSSHKGYWLNQPNTMHDADMYNIPMISNLGTNCRQFLFCHRTIRFVLELCNLTTVKLCSCCAWYKANKILLQYGNDWHLFCANSKPAYKLTFRKHHKIT